MKSKLLKLLSLVALVGLLVGSPSAQATFLTIDERIFQSGTGQTPADMTGTLDYTITGAQQVTITMTNTSLDAAFTDSTAPASMLLTGFGLNLGANILSGTVTVGATSTALNFDVGQSTTNVSNQYQYANKAIDGYNSISGVTPVSNVVTSQNNGQGTDFAGTGNIDGPGYGALSKNETQFGTSQPGIQDSVVFVLNLSGTPNTAAQVDALDVVLAFGSPDTLANGSGGNNENVPDGGTTVMLLGLAVTGLGAMRRYVSS